MNHTSPPNGAALGDEKTTLRFRATPSWSSIVGGLPLFLFLGMVAYDLLRSYLGLGLLAGVLALLGAIAATAVVWRLGNATVVVRSDAVDLRRPGRLRRTIAFDTIGRLKVHGQSAWTQARVAIDRSGARARSFFTFSLKEDETPLPGTPSFQAEVVKAILGRRPSVQTDAEVGSLLAGTLRLSAKQRVPVAIATGAAMLTAAYCLVTSVHQPFPPVLVVALQWSIAMAVSVSWSLERESEGRSALARLGLGAAGISGFASYLGFVYGHIEYLPLVFGASLACAIGGFAASLPLRLNAGRLTAGVGIMAVCLVSGAWALALGDTVPVRRVALWPAPYEVHFSPSGKVLVVSCLPRQSEEVKFLDVDTMLGRSVRVEGTLFGLVAVGDGCVVFLERVEHRSSLVALTADGKRRVICERNSISIPSPEALSPDGRRFAFFAADDDSSDAATIGILDVGTLELSSYNIRASQRQGSISWRKDGRLVWPARSVNSRAPRPDSNNTVFSVHSWKPGEDAPARVEHAVSDPCGNVAFSPYCMAALVSSWREGRLEHRLLRLTDGASLDIPATMAPDLRGRLSWSGDGRVLAYVAARNDRTLVVARTDTNEVVAMHESPVGEVTEVTVSPRGARVAFAVRGRIGAWCVTDLGTQKTRRLQPVVLFSIGASSWSPAGDLLAIPSIDFQMRNAGHDPRSLWIAAARDM
jgi:hypothetical protein